MRSLWPELEPPRDPLQGGTTISLAAFDAGTAKTFRTFPADPAGPCVLLPGLGTGIDGSSTCSVPPFDDPPPPPPAPPAPAPPVPPEHPGIRTTRSPLSRGSTTLSPAGGRFEAPLLEAELTEHGSATTMRSAPRVDTTTARLPVFDELLPLRVTVAQIAQPSAAARRIQMSGDALMTRREPIDASPSSPRRSSSSRSCDSPGRSASSAIAQATAGSGSPASDDSSRARSRRFASSFSRSRGIIGMLARIAAPQTSHIAAYPWVDAS